MNKVVNWLNQIMEFEGKISSAIAEHKITNFPGIYIYEDDLFNIATDPEIPINGYMILAISKEKSKLTDLTKDERNRLIDLSNRLLEAMHKSGFEKVMIYQDESSLENLHINFIPRHKWTYQFHNNISEMGQYAKRNLNINDKYRTKLLETIEIIRKNFNNNEKIEK